MRPFCFSVKGHVKMLRLALTVISMTFFILAKAPEPYIVVTGFEAVAVLFFIILYVFRLDNLMDCLFWPLLDIIHSVVSGIFTIIASVLALIPEHETLTVLGGVFGCMAALFCAADAAFIYQKLRLNPTGP
ncbi:chemokine-like factor [Suncus etruscus]|uniref:chemokine-like factor n=1 Tax=Suncus etruscus TaxID=109475 RepID=UPI00210FC76B|nr:chemokine-like factor [Suncus etruscus]